MRISLILQVLSPFTDDCLDYTESNHFNVSDVIAIIATVLSLFSIFISVYSIYKGKSLELRIAKFERIVIENINQLLLKIEKVFDDSYDELKLENVIKITDSLVNLELFLINFKDLYPIWKIQQISNIKEIFTDKLYNNQLTFEDHKVNYLAFKTRLYFELYEFAIENHISFWGAIKIYYKKCSSFFRHNIAAPLVILLVMCILLLCIFFR